MLSPSRTEGQYEWLDLSTLAAPEWLLEAATAPHRASESANGENRPNVSAALDGEPIPEGQRDDTLTSIAGRLHDGTRNLEALTQDLEAINEAGASRPSPAPGYRRSPGASTGGPPASRHHQLRMRRRWN